MTDRTSGVAAPNRTARNSAKDADGVDVPATLSDERILHLWDTHVAYQTGDSLALKDGDKLAFARAVLRASGVKVEGDGHA
jgi:hypothetical protein